MSTITIIIPSFNSKMYIENCLRKIDAAIPELLSDGTVSVLIKDGVSTDGTVELIKSCQQKYSWLTVVFKKDQSVYDAMNQATENCHSPWVYFLGSDDEILPDFSDALKFLSADVERKYIHYFNVELTSGGIYDGIFSKCKIIRKNICHQGVIYPTSILEFNPYPIKYKALGDWALNLKLFSHFQYHNLIIARYNDLSGLSNEYRDDVFNADKAELVLESFGFYYYFLARMLRILGRIKNAVR